VVFILCESIDWDHPPFFYHEKHKRHETAHPQHVDMAFSFFRVFGAFRGSKFSFISSYIREIWVLPLTDVEGRPTSIETHTANEKSCRQIQLTKSARGSGVPGPPFIAP
jgi:hypothetical protein